VTRVLALRALGLGDLLTVVPALRGLRARFGPAEICLAAPVALAPLVARIGAVDRLLAVPSAVRTPPGPLPGPPAWPGAAPSVAVNLHGRGPQSLTTLRGTDPAALWSYGMPGGPAWREEHEVTRWCRLVRWYGCPADPTDLCLGPWRGVDGPFVVHPGAASARRQWPAGRFAEVARVLARHGPVVVTGGRDERALASRVARDAGLPSASVVAGRTDLRALAELVARARLVVCGDTGVAHLATAFRTPSVVLFGPEPPARWGPPADGPHVALWRPAVDGGPPGVDPVVVDPRLGAISVAEVLAAVRELTPTTRAGPSRR
jgi:ADP-heptose:LPS heptosyltransferase